MRVQPSRHCSSRKQSKQSKTPDTGTGVAVDTAPGVTAAVVAADPAASMDVGAADDWFADVGDFDPTSIWGDGDEVTEAIPVLGAAAPAGASQPPSPANTCVDIGAVATSSSVTVARKQTEGSR